jgi:hypothetical protein
MNCIFPAIVAGKPLFCHIDNSLSTTPLAFHHNKGGRTNTAFSKQHSALFGRCEKSERKTLRANGDHSGGCPYRHGEPEGTDEGCVL